MLSSPFFGRSFWKAPIMPDCPDPAERWAQQQ
jgi:hypothetical protein